MGPGQCLKNVVSVLLDIQGTGAAWAKERCLIVYIDKARPQQMKEYPLSQSLLPP